MRIKSLEIGAMFNLGLSLEKQSRWIDAQEVYERILSNNKYHIDSSLRLAYTWYILGYYNKVVDTFE